MLIWTLLKMLFLFFNFVTRKIFNTLAKNLVSLKIQIFFLNFTWGNKFNTN